MNATRLHLGWLLARRGALLLLALLLATFTLSSVQLGAAVVGTSVLAATPVDFPDANLEAAVREALGKPTRDITQDDLAGLTSLDAPFRT